MFEYLIIRMLHEAGIAKFSRPRCFLEFLKEVAQTKVEDYLQVQTSGGQRCYRPARSSSGINCAARRLTGGDDDAGSPGPCVERRVADLRVTVGGPG